MILGHRYWKLLQSATDESVSQNSQKAKRSLSQSRSDVTVSAEVYYTLH